MKEHGIFYDFVSFWQNYANFSGRTPRRGYWMVQLWIAVIYILGFLLIGLLGFERLFGTIVGVNPFGIILSVAFVLFCLAIIIPANALLVRRLHDTGRTARWLWLYYSPHFISIILYVALAAVIAEAVTSSYGSMISGYGISLAEFGAALGGWLTVAVIAFIYSIVIAILFIVLAALPTSSDAIGVCTHTGKGAQSARPDRTKTASTATGTATIIGTKGMYSNASFALKDGEEIILGRDAAFAHIVIDQGAEKVSRKHLSVRYDAARACYIITDFSSNGTFKTDGTRLLANVPVTVPRGTTINLGSAQNSFLLN